MQKRLIEKNNQAPRSPTKRPARCAQHPPCEPVSSCGLRALNSGKRPRAAEHAEHFGTAGARKEEIRSLDDGPFSLLTVDRRHVLLAIGRRDRIGLALGEVLARVVPPALGAAEGRPDGAFPALEHLDPCLLCGNPAAPANVFLSALEQRPFRSDLCRILHAGLGQEPQDLGAPLPDPAVPPPHRHGAEHGPHGTLHHQEVGALQVVELRHGQQQVQPALLHVLIVLAESHPLDGQPNAPGGRYELRALAAAPRERAEHQDALHLHRDVLLEDLQRAHRQLDHALVHELLLHVLLVGRHAVERLQRLVQQLGVLRPHLHRGHDDPDHTLAHKPRRHGV
mmetsp:Transcript_40082/g.98508  ORF Transcript_40082/g.98508 Transcript_40082/m.98508 type:complete len:338 (-) Transcript_40082:1122-2135(-)